MKAEILALLKDAQLPKRTKYVVVQPFRVKQLWVDCYSDKPAKINTVTWGKGTIYIDVVIVDSPVDYNFVTKCWRIM